jgi:hypothetical protein
LIGLPFFPLGVGGRAGASIVSSIRVVAIAAIYVVTVAAINVDVIVIININVAAIVAAAVIPIAIVRDDRAHRRTGRKRHEGRAGSVNISRRRIINGWRI